MKSKLNKLTIFTSLLIAIAFVSVMAFVDITKAANTSDWKNGDPIPGGTYTVGNFMIKDYVDGSSDPNNIEDIDELSDKVLAFIMNDRTDNDFARTGFSLYVMKCNRAISFNSDGTRKKNPDGTNVSPWVQQTNLNSATQLDSQGWSAASYESQIISRLTTKHGADLANAIYAEMVAKGARVHVQPGSASYKNSSMVYNSTNPSATASDCNDNDRAYYYRNNDLNGTITITIDGESCDDPAYAEANPEKCGCENPEYAEANPEECNPSCEDPVYAAANPDKCKSPPPPASACEPITPANIASCSEADEVFKALTVPEVYTELKHNTVHQEQWEAMAGIPTTENLYYSVGGSEYMVQVELTSRKGNHVERNYNYTYQSVMARVCAKDKVCPEGWGTSDEPMPMPHEEYCGEDLTGDTLCQSWYSSPFCVDGYTTPITIAADGTSSGGNYVCTDYDYDNGFTGYSLFFPRMFKLFLTLL